MGALNGLGCRLRANLQGRLTSNCGEGSYQYWGSPVPAVRSAELQLRVTHSPRAGDLLLCRRRCRRGRRRWIVGVPRVAHVEPRAVDALVDREVFPHIHCRPPGVDDGVSTMVLPNRFGSTSATGVCCAAAGDFAVNNTTAAPATINAQRIGTRTSGPEHGSNAQTMSTFKRDGR